MDLKRILKLIEKRKTDLDELCKNSVLTDDDVLKKSRELDGLLNRYDYMLQKHSRKLN